MDLQIRRARPDEAAALTEIAHAAKRHWGYPENWIEHWQDDLTITADFIATNEMYVAVAGEEIAGCCALVMRDSLAELEHMWIRPDHMGNGVGRALFNQIVERARARRRRRSSFPPIRMPKVSISAWARRALVKFNPKSKDSRACCHGCRSILNPPRPLAEGSGERARSVRLKSRIYFARQ